MQGRILPSEAARIGGHRTHYSGDWPVYTTLCNNVNRLRFGLANIGKLTDTTKAMKKVTGIGGIFFKCDDPQKMKDWYAQQLGLPVSEYGTMFKWRDAGDPSKEGTTVWNAFDKNTTYFEPSKKDFMINYRVEHLEELVEQLRSCLS